MFSRPLITMLTLQRTNSSLSLSFLYWRGQNWIKYCECALPGAEWRGKIPSIDFLSSLLLVQLSIWLAFLAAWACHWPAVHRLFHPRCKTSHLLLLNFIMFLFSLFTSPACWPLRGHPALQNTKYTCPRAVPFCPWTCWECAASCHLSH